MFSLAASGVILSIVSVLKYWYANSSVRVKWHGTVGEYIPVKKGVRRGTVLSPSIFKFVLASCLQRLQPSIFYNDNLGISHVAYTDDVLLLSRTKHSLNTNFDRLSAALSTVGLSVNASKCEFILLGVFHQHHLFAWVLQLYHVQQVLNGWISLFHVSFVYLLRHYVHRAEKYAGWLRKNFTKLWSV